MGKLRRTDDLYGALTFPMRAKLLGAVFFTFAPLPILLVSHFEERRSWAALGAYAVLGGFTAAGWAYTFMKSRRFLWVLLPSQTLWFVLPAFVFPRDFQTGFTPSREGAACIVAIVVGYVLFIKYIRREGARSIRMQTELALAGEIHANLIPPVALRTPRLDIYGRSSACSEMGGDLLDVLSDGEAVGAYVADVSGHGVKAGVVMAMTKAAVRMRLRSSGDLAGLLNDLNAVHSELTGGGMFVTAACLRFRSVDGRMEAEFVGAGHGPVLHWRRRTGRIDRIESEHLPLGIVASETYAARGLAVEAGDVLLLMTDGLFEVFNEQGQPLGQDPIEATFAEQATRPLEVIYARVMSMVGAYGKQIDDQTLLLIRVA